MAERMVIAVEVVNSGKDVLSADHIRELESSMLIALNGFNARQYMIHRRGVCLLFTKAKTTAVEAQ